MACDVRGGVWFKELEPVLTRVEAAQRGAPARGLPRGVRRVAAQPLPRDAPAPSAVGRRARWPEGIERERAELAEVRARADLVIDTTGMSIWDLRRRVTEALMTPETRPRMHVEFVSFGYKYGVPRDADLLFDVRFLRNPHYIPELNPLTGLDAPVADFVAAAPGMDEFRTRLESLLDFLLPAYAQEGKSSVVIGIGCTGGRHRSVAIAEMLAARYSRALDVNVSHRNIDRSTGAPTEPA